VAVQYFHEPRHVGALDISRQRDRHADLGNRGLNGAIGHAQAHRVSQSFDTDAIDGLIAGIDQGLNVG